MTVESTANLDRDVSVHKVFAMAGFTHFAQASLLYGGWKQAYQAAMYRLHFFTRVEQALSDHKELLAEITTPPPELTVDGDFELEDVTLWSPQAIALVNLTRTLSPWRDIGIVKKIMADTARETTNSYTYVAEVADKAAQLIPLSRRRSKIVVLSCILDARQCLDADCGHGLWMIGRSLIGKQSGLYRTYNWLSTKQKNENNIAILDLHSSP